MARPAPHRLCRVFLPMEDQTGAHRKFHTWLGRLTQSDKVEVHMDGHWLPQSVRWQPHGHDSEV